MPTFQFTNRCFHRFLRLAESITLPNKFTYPFNYQPHPLAVFAATQVQEVLIPQTQWNHDFGVDHFVEGSNIGKMFGVLVVQTRDGELGFLAAFSGKVGECNRFDGFVPPIVDTLDPEGFFKQGEKYISTLNAKIDELLIDPNYLALKQAVQRVKEDGEQQLVNYKQRMKQAKHERDSLRKEQEGVLTSVDFEELKEGLKNQSLKWQYDLKMLQKEVAQEVALAEQQLGEYEKEIERLKVERKERSAALQQRLFEGYQFLDKTKQKLEVRAIFANHPAGPPAGTGECAAPKLLQYAFENDLRPVALAEFWWGQSPKSEVRIHKNFYPSCKSKCEPVLGYMLNGIELDINPTLLNAAYAKEPEIIFEDDYLGVVEKPYNYLSVPGKIDAPSLFNYLQNRYPMATGPIIVHRLDMATSGIMVFAKTMEVYVELQNQFTQRKVKKYYIALLQGDVAQDEGTIKLPLRVDLDNRPNQLVCYEYGKPAVTHYKVLARKEGQTLVRFQPITGRTHQLRVHAAHPDGLNAPIVGDDLYGQPSERLFLHAAYLKFVHPITLKSMIFKSESSFFSYT